MGGWVGGGGVRCGGWGEGRALHLLPHARRHARLPVPVGALVAPAQHVLCTGPQRRKRRGLFGRGPGGGRGWGGGPGRGVKRVGRGWGTHLDLLRGPCVEVDRLDLGDVRPDRAVHAGALDAHEDAQVPRRPARICTRSTNGIEHEPVGENEDPEAEQRDLLLVRRSSLERHAQHEPGKHSQHAPSSASQRRPQACTQSTSSSSHPRASHVPSRARSVSLSLSPSRSSLCPPSRSRSLLRSCARALSREPLLAFGSAVGADAVGRLSEHGVEDLTVPLVQRLARLALPARRHGRQWRRERERERARKQRGREKGKGK